MIGSYSKIIVYFTIYNIKYGIRHTPFSYISSPAPWHPNNLLPDGWETGWSLSQWHVVRNNAITVLLCMFMLLSFSFMASLSSIQVYIVAISNNVIRLATCYNRLATNCYKMVAILCRLLWGIPYFTTRWLILSVYIIMSFDFPFVRLFGVR